jgi:NTE family protein
MKKRNPENILKNLKIGLALGGGAIRGAAHLGILSVFEEEGIKITKIAGTSAGAIVGGNYASNPSAKEIFKKLSVALYKLVNEKEKFGFFLRTDESVPFTKKIKDALFKGLFYGTAITKGAVMKPEEYEAVIGELIEDKEIEGLPIPFITTAVDVKSGKGVYIKRGSLKKAVMASSAIPGIFPPVEMDGMILVDGGWLYPVPVIPLLKEKLDIIIGVDISPEIKEETEFSTGINIIMRTNFITREYLKNMQLKYADIVIKPQVSNVHPGDVSKFEYCYARGVEAARLAIPKILEVAERKKKKPYEGEEESPL